MARLSRGRVGGTKAFVRLERDGGGMSQAEYRRVGEREGGREEGALTLTPTTRIEDCFERKPLSASVKFHLISSSVGTGCDFLSFNLWDILYATHESWPVTSVATFDVFYLGKGRRPSRSRVRAWMVMSLQTPDISKAWRRAQNHTGVPKSRKHVPSAH